MTSFKLSKEISEIYNQIYSVFQAYDQKGCIYYAKIFSISKLQQHGLEETLEYNEEVLSDMQGIAFPQHINRIIASIPNDGLFTFITEPYQKNLSEYMKATRITESQALQIFDQILKAIYSLYSNGYWHKNIRPQHFVKIGNVWKLDSLVYIQDISESKGLQSDFIWSPEYQPPQVYERNVQTFTDEELLPIVVWNLGSLLLDLFFSVHKLKNLDILKRYKGKKFTLEDINVKKTDLFSKKLKEILGQMLHYDAKARMKMQDVFSNQYLSKQVAASFKKKHKNSIAGAVRIFTGGKSVLSSALFSKQQRDKGSRILPINEMIKTTMQSIYNQIKQTYALRQTKSEKQIQSDEHMIEKVSLFSHLIKSQARDAQLFKGFTKDSQVLTNQELDDALKLYKSNFDKSQLLSITGAKFGEINYKDNRKQINLISKYAVQVCSYINLNKMVTDMNRNLNTFGLDSDIYSKFQSSRQYQALKRIVNNKLEEKEKNIQKIRQSIQELPASQKKLVQQNQIKKFLLVAFKKQSFLEIKTSYRKILKISYDIVTKQYNNDLDNQKLARLAIYIVYSLTIDKLYITNMIEKNFQAYFLWAKQTPSSYIPLKNFQKYIEQASVKTLILHAKQILERYFKL